MAGHFLLLNISQTDLGIACSSLGGELSPPVHTNVPTSAKSLTSLASVLNCGSIRNRKHLPRHVYLHFYTLFEPDIVPQWIHALRRPHGVGFGLKSLCGPAQNAWDQGDQQGAISAQAANGRATVEIYFIGGSRP